MGVLFPILTVKRRDDNVRWSRIQAADIDRITVGIGAWHIKGLDATMFAEQVLGGAGIEGISSQVILA